MLRLITAIKNGRIVGENNISCFYRQYLWCILFASIHFEFVSYFSFLGDSLYPFSSVIFNAIEHLSLVKWTHLIENFLPKVSDLFEGLNLILSHNFFKRKQIEVECMRKVEAKFACLLQSIWEIILLEIVMKDQIVAYLGDLFRTYVHKTADLCGNARWNGREWSGNGW